MKLFQNEILSQAIQLRSHQVQLPAWLNQAKMAFHQFERAALSSQSIDELATTLAKIPDWPQSHEELNRTLDELAAPVVKMASRAFCRIAKNPMGEPAAYIWGADARIVAAKTGLYFEAGSILSYIEKSTASDLFNQTPWSATAPGQPELHHLLSSEHLIASQAAAHAQAQKVTPQIRLSEQLDEAAAILQAIQDDNTPDTFRNPARRQSDAPTDAVSLAQQRASERLTAARLKGGFFPQVLLMSTGDLIDAQDFAVEGIPGSPDAVPVKTMYFGTFHQPNRDFSNDFGQGLLDLQRSSQVDASWEQFKTKAVDEKKNLSSPAFFNSTPSQIFSQPSQSTVEANSFSFAPYAGFQRGAELMSAIQYLGTRSLTSAQAQAGQRLVSFIEEHAPHEALASSMAEKLWGAPLSLADAKTAAPWASITQELMTRDTRGALITFAIAPKLGINPSLQAIEETHNQLQQFGLTPAAYRALNTLPDSDFKNILSSFKSDQPGQSTGDIAKKISLAFDLSRESGLPLEQSIAACLPKPNELSQNWSSTQNFSAEAIKPFAKTEGHMITSHFDQVEQASARQHAPYILHHSLLEAKKDPKAANEHLNQITQWIRESAEGLWQTIPDKARPSALIEIAQHFSNSTSGRSENWTPLGMPDFVVNDITVTEISNVGQLRTLEQSINQATSTLLYGAMHDETRLFAMKDPSGTNMGVIAVGLQSITPEQDVTTHIFHSAAAQNTSHLSQPMTAYVSGAIGRKDADKNQELSGVVNQLLERVTEQLHKPSQPVDFKQALQDRRDELGGTPEMKPNNPAPGSTFS